MRTASGVVFLVVAVVVGAAFGATSTDQPKIVDDVYHAITTVRDMYSLGGALESYYMDNKRFPNVGSSSELRALLQGRYAFAIATEDAWGTPIRYLVTPDGQDYRLVSAGSDKTFSEETWDKPGTFTDSRSDAVYSRHFIRKWAIDIP